MDVALAWYVYSVAACHAKATGWAGRVRTVPGSRTGQTYIAIRAPHRRHQHHHAAHSPTQSYKIYSEDPDTWKEKQNRYQR